MNTRNHYRLYFYGKITFSVVLLYIAFILSGCSSRSDKENEKITVFKNVSIIDAVHGSRAGQSVVVKGNRIAGAGMVKDIEEPAGANVVDCTGKFMIPGLWDAHVHLTNNNFLLPVMYPLLIVNGITYIRDTGATLEGILPLREKAREASLKNGMAPQVFMIGPHMDGLQLSWGSSVSVVSREQAHFITNCLIKEGVDELKMYDLLKREVALEVLSIGLNRGYNVCAHVPLDMDVVEASNAGLSGMEHMYNLEMSCSSDWDSLLTARQQMIADGSEKSGNELRVGIYHSQRMHAFRTQDEKRREVVLNALAENNTWQVPTLVILAQAEHKVYGRKDYREKFRYLPETLRTEWEKNAAGKMKQDPPQEGLAHALWAYDMIPRLVEKGIGIMAGTDMPLGLLIPGVSLHEELALLVRSGLTPLQAIESATLKPAQYYELENQQGSIAKGMMADLIILDDDPLEDITNTQKINAIMRNGFLHAREDLDKMLDQLEKHGKLLSR